MFEKFHQHTASVYYAKNGVLLGAAFTIDAASLEVSFYLDSFFTQVFLIGLFSHIYVTLDMYTEFFTQLFVP